MRLQPNINRVHSVRFSVVVGSSPVSLMPRITILLLCLPQQLKAMQIPATKAVELELKLRVPAASILHFLLRLQLLKVFGSGSRTTWSIKNLKPM